MEIRQATPDEPLRNRTADVTRGRMHLVEHSWPENVTTAGEPIIAIDPNGGRHQLVLHAFATNAASAMSAGR